MPTASLSSQLAKMTLAVLVWIAVAALPSTATALTVFDFDDFPESQVPTTDYGCDGKAVCDGSDTDLARSSQIGLESLSTVRDGIEGLFPDLSGLVVEGVPGDRFLTGTDCGGICVMIQVITSDFSKDLLFAQVDLATPEFVSFFSGETGEGDFGGPGRG